MRSDEAIFNWLQIKVVAMARPQDAAATKTLEFFEQILLEDFNISHIHIEHSSDTYSVHYDIEGAIHNKQYRQQLVEQLLTDIETNPKYNEA